MTKDLLPKARGAICAVLEPWFAARTLPEVRAAFDRQGVLWGPYQDFGQMVAEDPRVSPANPMFAEVEHPELGRSLTYAVSKWQSTEPDWVVGRRAPLLGEDTEAISAELTAARPAPAPTTRKANPGTWAAAS